MTIVSGLSQPLDDIGHVLNSIFKKSEETVEELRLSLSSHPAYSAQQTNQSQSLISSTSPLLQCSLESCPDSIARSSSIQTEDTEDVICEILPVDPCRLLSLIEMEIIGLARVPVDNFVSGCPSKESSFEGLSEENMSMLENLTHKIDVGTDGLLQVAVPDSCDLLPGEADTTDVGCSSETVIAYIKLPYSSKYAQNDSVDCQATHHAEGISSSIEAFHLDEEFDYDNVKLTPKF